MTKQEWSETVSRLADAEKRASEEVQQAYNTQSPELPDPEDMGLPELAYLTISEPPLPEAGGVAWIDLYGTRTLEVDGKQIRKVFKISLTCRATTPIAALDGLKEAIDHAEKKYKLFPHSL